MLTNLIYRRHYSRQMDSANIARTFLLESLETSKLARMVQRYRRAVILAQQRFRFVQEKYRIQQYILNLLWEKFEDQFWEEKTSSMLKDSEDPNNPAKKLAASKGRRGTTSVSITRPKVIPDDIRYRVISDDLTRRRHEFWKKLSIYEKALAEWKAERPNVSQTTGGMNQLITLLFHR